MSGTTANPLRLAVFRGAGALSVPFFGVFIRMQSAASKAAVQDTRAMCGRARMVAKKYPNANANANANA
jgi:hypothetical protein